MVKIIPALVGMELVHDLAARLPECVIGSYGHFVAQQFFEFGKELVNWVQVRAIEGRYFSVAPRALTLPTVESGNIP